MLKVWPRCFDNLFGIRDVFHSCHFRHLSIGFHLCSTSVLAAQPHLQNIVDICHCVQCSFLCKFLQFQLMFSFRVIQCCAITCQYSVIGSSKLPYFHFISSVSCVVLDCLQPIKSRPRETLASTPTPWGRIENMLCATLERSAYFVCASSC